jgi:hypothetical protein
MCERQRISLATSYKFAAEVLDANVTGLLEVVLVSVDNTFRSAVPEKRYFCKSVQIKEVIALI